MEAKLIVENVGGIDNREITLKPGTVTILSGPNRCGKTSIIKALVAVLSTPSVGKFISAFDEAVKFGITGRGRGAKEGFVNIHSETAKVILEYNGKKEILELDREGNYINTPKGVEKFLLVGVLSHLSRVYRQLNNLTDKYQPDDYTWIISDLSKAANYEEARKVILNYIDDVDSQIKKSETILSSISSYTLKLTELDDEKLKLDKSLKDLQKHFGAKESDDSKFINEKLKQLDDLKKQRRKLVDQLMDLQRQEASKKNKIREYSNQLEDLKTKREKKKSDLDGIRGELREFNLDAYLSKVDQEFDVLRKERDSLEGIYNLLQVASTATSSGNECPLCGSRNYNIENINKKLNDIENRKREINKKLLELSKSKQRAKQRFSYLTDEEKKLVAELKEIDDKIVTLKDTIDREGYLPLKQIQSEIEKKQEEIDDKDREISRITELIKGKNVELAKKIESIQKRIKEIDNEIYHFKQKILELKINYEGLELDPQTSKKVFESIKEGLEELREFVDKRIAEQKRKATNEFNQNMSALISEIGFKEFKTINLTNEGKLYVERYNPEKGDYDFQDPRSLSTSEKVITSLILQLALKDTYLRDIPFFIVDDILEDLDEKLREKIIGYLKKKSVENNYFVIATKISEGLEGLRVEYI